MHGHLNYGWWRLVLSVGGNLTPVTALEYAPSPRGLNGKPTLFTPSKALAGCHCDAYPDVGGLDARCHMGVDLEYALGDNHSSDCRQTKEFKEDRPQGNFRE